MGSVWPGEDPDRKFYGVVTKCLKYKGRKGEKVDGHEVIWDDGARERWPYKHLLDSLIPLGDKLIHNDDSDSSDDDGDDNSSDDDDVSDDDSDVGDDVFSCMSERDDPEGFEYQQMFSSRNTGDDVVIPSEC